MNMYIYYHCALFVGIFVLFRDILRPKLADVLPISLIEPSIFKQDLHNTLPVYYWSL